jgi:hypothetical protein
MYNELFSYVFFSVKHDSNDLTKEFNVDELLMIYSDGIDMALSINDIISKQGIINSEFKIPVTKLICHRIHLIEQLSVVKQSLIKLGFKGMEDSLNTNYEILYN